MIALCAAATALLLAGLLAGGFLGKVLIVVALLGNLAWLTVTFVKWWRLASDRARLIVFAATVAYVVAWFVIRVAAGPLAAWVLGLGFVGYVGTVTGALMTTGYLAAHHAKSTQHAIATGKIKEIQR
jgi:hypothetical protein